MIDILTKITLVGFLFLCFSFQGIYEEKVYGSEYTSFANGLETKFRYREASKRLLSFEHFQSRIHQEAKDTGFVEII